MRPWRRIGLAVLAAVLATTASAAHAAGDPERGRKIFRKCNACHQVGETAKNRTGPQLNDIVNRRAARVADFRYSDAMRRAGEDGLHWTEENLDAFLADPREFLPGTRMSFRGLRKARDRADVIAYLTEFSGENLSQKVDAGFSVDPEVLQIAGDVEYGEYLSSECTTCHQPDGENDGIPGIVGWHRDAFVTALHAYKEGHRKHPVMEMIAGRLDNQEIAALAAYFEGLGN